MCGGVVFNNKSQTEREEEREREKERENVTSADEMAAWADVHVSAGC